MGSASDPEACWSPKLPSRCDLSTYFINKYGVHSASQRKYDFWLLQSSYNQPSCFGLYKRAVIDYSKQYYDLCYGSLQLALTKNFYLVFLGLLAFDDFWGPTQRAGFNSADGGCYGLQKQVRYMDMQGLWWHTMWAAADVLAGICLSYLIMDSCLLLWSLGCAGLSAF